MTQFRPCIDLHHGQVKQIVGGTLRDDESEEQTSLVENHVAEHPPAWFAEKYRVDSLTGGHVIKLGGGNDEAAREALAAYPGGLQIGGGITADNAATWLDAGASHVVVTSWLIDDTLQMSMERLEALVRAIGKSRIVIDLSCRRTNGENEAPTWHVAMNRWQTITRVAIDESTLDDLSTYADEFLIHAADVEGLCAGVDEALVERLGQWARLPMTYAGGVASMQDIHFIDQASESKVDVTVGSALDLFGGNGVTYSQLLAWNRGKRPAR